MSEIQALIEIINQTGGIPLVIKTTTTTNWFQLLLTLLMGSFMVIFLLYKYGESFISNIISNIYLYKLKKKYDCEFIKVKHTEVSFFGGSMIDRNMALELQKKIYKIKKKNIFLILHTPGGEVFGTELISRIIRNSKKNIIAIVPLYAMSGGTLLSLSCDKIIMSEIASLGPVDIQIGGLFKRGAVRDWKDTLKYKGKKSDDETILITKMAKKYENSQKRMFEDLLRNKVPSNKLKETVSILTDGKLPHGYAFSSKELINMGLKIDKLPQKDMEIITKAIIKAKEGVS
jgi:hypothetical protein